MGESTSRCYRSICIYFKNLISSQLQHLGCLDYVNYLCLRTGDGVTEFDKDRSDFLKPYLCKVKVEFKIKLSVYKHFSHIIELILFECFVSHTHILTNLFLVRSTHGHNPSNFTVQLALKQMLEHCYFSISMHIRMNEHQPQWFIMICDVLTCDSNYNVLRSALSISRLCRGALDLCSHILCQSWLDLCRGLWLATSCRFLIGDRSGLISRSGLACGCDDSWSGHTSLNLSQKLRGSCRGGAGIRLSSCDSCYSNTGPLGLGCRLDLTYVA